MAELDYKAIGERVRQLRTQRGYTQEKLSELAGISPQHFSNIENGMTKVALPTLIKITNALDCSIETVLCDSLSHAKPVYQNEILLETQDCDETEVRIIADIVKAAKQSLRNRLPGKDGGET